MYDTGSPQGYGTGPPHGVEHIPQYRGFPDQAVSPTSPQQDHSKEVAPSQVGTHGGGHSTIFGVRRSTFILSLLLILVIIIAAVGGGVGGSVAVNKAYE